MSESAGKPEPYLTGKESAIPWNQWKKSFVVYTQRREFQLKRMQRPVPEGGDAVQGQQPEAYSHIEKNLDLFALLGNEGQRLFNGTPDSDNFGRPHDDILNICDRLFRVKVNTLLALHRFRKCEQRPGESTTDFLAELRVLAKNCEFESAAQENSEIAQTLVLNCFDENLKEKLFEKYTKQTPLQEIYDFMCAHEQAKSDVKQLKTGTKNFSIAPVQVKQKFQKKGQKLSSAKYSKGDISCMGCGRQGHEHGTNSCPAFKKTCHFCKTENHFDSVCLKKKKSEQQKHQASLKKVRTSPLSKKGIEGKIACKLQLCPIQSVKDTATIEFMADSGADISTIQSHLYKRHFQHVPMQDSDVNLGNFDNSKSAQPLGRIQFHATYSPDHQGEITVYIVPDRCLTVIGLDDLAVLNLKLDPKTRSVCSLASKKQDPPSEELLNSLEKEFPVLFSPGIGKVPNFQHKIHLKENATPKRFKLRHPPIAIQEKAKDAVEELFKSDIIEKADTSEYVHPLHFVWKPDGSVRTTVDFSRGLNQDLVPASHPLPLPSDIFNRVGDDKFFSKLDISQAYHHIELAPESRPLTAFLTESHGLCQFKRLPMGMTDSGAIFQQQIEKCVSGLEGVHPYMDDIFIQGRTRQEHDERLRSTLKKLQLSDFRLKRPKLVIAVNEISLLGYILKATAIGTTVSPDPRNGDSIRNLRPPTDIHEVRQFLGCCNYYASFIRDYAELTEPLHKLTRKNAKFLWDNQCQTSFEILKQRIVSPEVLTPFNPNLQTVLTTDASDVGLGAVLSQRVNDQDRPIAFAAKTLSNTERNYSAPEKETLACVWGTEHFEKFLLGRHFTLQTDQSSLQTLLHRFSGNRTSRRISRWYDRLSHFTYTVKHIPGKKNVCADMLSRLGAELTTSSEPVLPDDNDHTIIASISAFSTVTVEEIVSESLDDPILKQVRIYMRSGNWPSRKQLPGDLRKYFDIREELSEKNGCLLRGEKWIVPASIQQKILVLLHSGHPGIVRMKQKYNEAYYWPGGLKMVEDYVKQCTACHMSGKSNRPEPVPVTAIQPPTEPWQKIAIDITGPFWTAPKTQQNVVVITDYFSKFPEILLTDSITSGKIISWLEEIFARYGNPLEIVSDNGPQFVSNEFEDFLKNQNIRHNKTSVYNPAQNGLVEVFNRSVKFGARAITAEGGSFKKGLLKMLASFRSTAPENGLSPSQLLFGWNIRSESDIRNVKLLPKQEGGDTTKEQKALTMIDRKNAVKKKFQSRRYGKCNKKNPRSPYMVGDTVCHKKPPESVRKGQSPLSPPMKITEVIGKWTYKLDDGQIWNARKLVRFRSSKSADDLEEEDFLLYGYGEPNIHLQARRQPEQNLRRSKRLNFGIPPTRYSSPPLRGRNL